MRLSITGIALIVAAGRASAQDWARQRPEPRHQEWAQVAQDVRTLHAFLVFPEVTQTAWAVVVIHEIRA